MREENNSLFKGCLIYILIFLVGSMILIAISAIGIFFYNRNLEQQAQVQNENIENLYKSSTKDKNGKCLPITEGKDFEEITLIAARYFACENLGLEKPKLEKWDINKHSYFLEVGGDSTSRELGYFYVYDYKNLQRGKEFKTKTTVLQNLVTIVVEDRYQVIFIGNIFGAETCPVLMNEQFYPYCKYLKEDLVDIGGVYLLDTETMELIKLQSFDPKII